MSRNTVARRLGDERGSVLVVAGVIALVFVLLGAVIVEVGQWFEHRRAIQTRADAAAFAGGQELANCFNIGLNNITEQSVDTQIEDWAKSYGGIQGGASTQTGAPYNRQFGTSSSNLMSFQSNTYPSAGTPNPTKDLGNECYQANGTANLMLDVKMTQGGIPPLFSISPFETVHGWARVQLQEIQSLVPSMPLAVPDVRPSEVAVTFVNNATGTALTGCSEGGTSVPGCVFQLTAPSQSVNQLNDWTGSATIPMPAANSNVGMRVGIGSNVGSCAGVNAVKTSTANYVCYDYSTTGQASPDGIIDLRAYDPGPGTASAPVLQAVTPTTTCSNSTYLSPFFSIYQGGTCDADVTATIDFGSGGPPSGAHVQATIDGQTVALTNTSGNTWATPSANPVSLPLEGGPYPVTMSWCVGTCGNKNNFTPFNAGNPVQQFFSGSDGSSAILPGGPIFAATVTGSGTSSSYGASYSFPANHDATVSVDVGLTGGVHLPVRCDPQTSGSGSGGSYNCPSDPPVLLRFTTGSGNDSLTYAIDCASTNKTWNLQDQIENGCTDAFSINNKDLCPDPSNPTPPDCAPVQTGAATGQVQKGMNARFAPNNVCDPNNYPVVSATDPRAVTLIITDFSGFTGSGGSSASDVPVITYATFYVTGWDGAPTSCTSGSNPINEPDANDPSKGQGSNIWGHFVKDIQMKGTPSGKTCPSTGVAPCVPALVR